MSNFLPVKQIFKGTICYTPFGNPRKIENFEIIIEKSAGGNIIRFFNYYDMKGNMTFKNRMELDKSLKIIKNKFQILNLANKEKIPYDSLEAVISSDKKKLVISDFLNGIKNKETRTLVYNNNTVYIDTITLFLAGCLNKGIKNFKAEMIIDSQKIKIPVEFKLITTKNLLELSPEYTDVPDFFVKGALSKEELYVFVFNFAGVAWPFYPHKWYVAYKKEAPHQLVAYWGEDPQYPFFQLVESVE
jgi:antitoxin component YwqK of YwqJK toxin-antitoxin module